MSPFLEPQLFRVAEKDAPAGAIGVFATHIDAQCVLSRHAAREKTMAQAETLANEFMPHIAQMLQTHPGQPPMDRAALQTCIEACLDCVQACTSCADACVAENNVNLLRRCIRLNLDCGDLCETTAKILSRRTAFEPPLARAAIEACAFACQLCGGECEDHGPQMPHCAVCADACRRCEEACRTLLTSIRFQ